MSRRRVVVTGLGCVSPVGNTAQESWTRILAGQSGIDRITHGVDRDVAPGDRDALHIIGGQIVGRQRVAVVRSSSSNAVSKTQERCTRRNSADGVGSGHHRWCGLLGPHW